MADVGTASQLRTKLVELMTVKLLAWVVGIVCTTGTATAVFVYLWHNNVQPQIDLYFVGQINSYFSDQEELAKSARRVDPNIATKAKSDLNEVKELKQQIQNLDMLSQQLAAKITNTRDQLQARIDELSKGLYGDVDAVYPIYLRYTQANLNDPKSDVLAPIYIYANPSRHRITVSLRRKGLAFDIEFCINNETSGCRQIDPNIYTDEDITPEIAKNQSHGAGSGRETEEPRKVSGNDTQKIFIRPTNHADFKPETIAFLEGYILVSRALPK